MRRNSTTLLRHPLVSRLMCTLSINRAERNKQTTHHMAHVHLSPSFVRKLIYTVTNSYYPMQRFSIIIGLRSVSNGLIQQLPSDMGGRKKNKNKKPTKQKQPPTPFKFRPQSKQTTCFLPFPLGLVSDFPQIYNSLECTK